MTDELFTEIMQWAFVVFSWISIFILFGLAIGLFVWMADNLFRFVDVCFEINKNRKQMAVRVEKMWLDYERREDEQWDKAIAATEKRMEKENE